MLGRGCLGRRANPANCAQASALAFPTPGTTVQINSIGVLSGAEVEQINVSGSFSNRGVYMGPYEIKGTNGSPFVEYMMCFNAGAVASAGPAKAMDNAGASAIFGTEKINMISWLASQWQSPITSPTAIATNADINKAIWEIMADYANGGWALISTGGSFYLNAGDGDIGDVTTWLTLALAHTGDTSTAANFLVPIAERSIRYALPTIRRTGSRARNPPSTWLRFGGSRPARMAEAKQGTEVGASLERVVANQGRGHPRPCSFLSTVCASVHCYRVVGLGV